VTAVQLDHEGTRRDRRPIPRAATLGFNRLAAGFVMALLIAGCLVLWIGVPAGSLWLSGELTDSFGWHMPIALVLLLPGMLGVALLLIWLNGLYLRITGGETIATGEGEIRRRGPLEPLLVATLVLALISLFVWFFGFAENPSPRTW
jgi:hypothetical protein